VNKTKQQKSLAFFTFIALIALLAIQVNWLFRAAKLEEDHFTSMVTRALVEARKEIGNSASSCNDMNNYLCGNPCQMKVQKIKIEELDSIIKSKLEIYHIELDYTFEITDSIYKRPNTKLFQSRCYLQSLNGELGKDGIKIRLQFPNQYQFLMAQFQGTFLLAFFFVIFVMISFIITFRMFKKERQIVQHTSDFINNMVHEFQTPLTNIRLAANMIKKKEPLSDQKKIADYIDVILKENHKLEKHVVDILTVSSTESDNFKEEPIDIHKIIEQLALEFTTRINSSKGTILLQLTASHFVLEVEKNHILIILSNLIDNAIKYTIEPPAITISTRNIKGMLIIGVKDQGIGIDKKNSQKIFDKYFRISTGDVHNVKGFGLGLSYVKKLVEHCNGKIEVTSSKQTGTIFTISLPLKNETD
jgi:two-component system phosphate regulon sensor histidine kinase PhoR